jgi:hypothetical protein
MVDIKKIKPKNVAEIRKNIYDIPEKSGIYFHFVNKNGLKLLGLDNIDDIQQMVFDDEELYLIYIGLAKNLQERYLWHLGFNNISESSIISGFLSTLRLSYMANLENIESLSQQDELNKFMDKYTFSKYIITKDYKNGEELFIKKYPTPLNIKDNNHSFVKINKMKRKKIRDKYISNKNIEVKPAKTMITDEELLEYAKIAKKENIKNQSQFIKWFREIKLKSASEKRLKKAWNEL